MAEEEKNEVVAEATPEGTPEQVEPKAETAPEVAAPEAAAPEAAAPEAAPEVVEKAAAPKKEAEKKAAPKAEAGDADSTEQPAAVPTARKSRGKGISPLGVVHIRATFNNTIVSITDMKGNVVSWSTGGRCGFKGSRKSTAFAATTVAQEAARSAVSQGMHEVEVRVQGPGAGRESAVRALQAAGLTVTAIRDCTPIPHNGCRPRKRRRV